MKWALKINEWLPTRSPRGRWKDQVKNIIRKFKKRKWGLSEDECVKDDGDKWRRI
jgi:hypothetical protein